MIAFETWLDTHAIHPYPNGCLIALLSHATNSRVSMIYKESNNKSYEFKGIYDHKKKILYTEDTTIPVHHIHSLNSVIESLQCKMEAEIESILKKTFGAPGIPSRKELPDARQAAETIWLTGSYEDTAVKGHFMDMPMEFTPETLAKYVCSPEETVQGEAEKYVAGHAKQLEQAYRMRTFVDSLVDMLNQGIGVTKDMRARKKMLFYLKENLPENAKTVTVTVNKNIAAHKTDNPGIICRFKYPAYLLQHPSASTYKIKYAVPQPFNYTFQKGSVFHAEDILAITHGRKRIYDYMWQML